MRRYRRLEDALLELGLVNREELRHACEIRDSQGKRLGDILVGQGVITERQLLDAICLQLDVPFVDLSKEMVSGELASVLPKNLARRHGVVPVRLEDGVLYLAMKDPMDFMAVEDVKMASRCSVVRMMAAANGIERRFQELYGGEGVTKAIEEMKKQGEEKEGRNPQELYLEMEHDTSSAPTIRLVNSLLDRGAAEGASDIHLEPREKALSVRMRIDGVLHEILEVPANLQASVISRIKVMGGMDITERRVPQDGRASMHFKGQTIDLRISTLPVIYGEKVVIRLLNQSTELLNREGIGLTGENLARFEKLLSRRSGVILMVGPTGSGKTSTLYTMIRELNEEGINLVTLEDPVEYHIEGVNQVAIHEKAGMTFAGGLRSILRQDPDMIAVGEIRDGETAEIAMRSALTGHLVLSTIHTNDALTTIDRLRDIGVAPYLIARAVNGIISQRLVKRICPNCRTAYHPDVEEKRLLGIDTEDEVVFYRGSGCPHCFDTGYRGRIGVFEIVLMNQKARQCILDGGNREELLKALKDPAFVSMEEELRRLVLEGVTSVEEAEKTRKALWM